MVCDLAETYHIFKYKELPPSLVATLVFGLGHDARVKRKNELTMCDYLLGVIADNTAMTAWLQTSDARTGSNRPESIIERWNAMDRKEELHGFDSLEAFERARENILND